MARLQSALDLKVCSLLRESPLIPCYAVQNKIMEFAKCAPHPIVDEVFEKHSWENHPYISPFVMYDVEQEYAELSEEFEELNVGSARYITFVGSRHDRVKKRLHCLRMILRHFDPDELGENEEWYELYREGQDSMIEQHQEEVWDAYERRLLQQEAAWEAENDMEFENGIDARLWGTDRNSEDEEYEVSEGDSDDMEDEE